MCLLKLFMHGMSALFPKYWNEFQVGNSVIDVIRLNSLFFPLLDFRVHIATFSNKI